jgi:hypothetical protein
VLVELHGGGRVENVQREKRLLGTLTTDRLDNLFRREHLVNVNRRRRHIHCLALSLAGPYELRVEMRVVAKSVGRGLVAVEVRQGRWRVVSAFRHLVLVVVDRNHLVDVRSARPCHSSQSPVVVVRPLAISAARSFARLSDRTCPNG